MKLTLTQQALCSLVAENLFEKKSVLPDGVDWAEVYKESRLQAVTLLAFQNRESLPLDEELQKRISDRLSRTLVANAANFKAHQHLHRLMQENKIPYCVLKGIASAHYYPSPLTRNMGDVDFYVSPDDAKSVCAVLEKDGFVMDRIEQAHHTVFRKTGMHYELHREVAGVPDGKVGERVREFLAGLTESAVETTDEFVKYRAPSPFHHGLILLLHMQHHLLSEGIGLRHLCDWAVFVNGFSEEEFTSTFEEKLSAVGLWSFAKTVSLAASVAFGLPYREWMGKNTELAEAVAEDIFLGGNFGRKAPERAYEGMMISNRGKDGVKGNRLKQGFGALNRIVRSHWPAAAKFPPLYPVGWVWFSLRYLVLAAFGKRRAFNPLDAYVRSGDRKKLYAALELFES